MAASDTPTTDASRQPAGGVARDDLQGDASFPPQPPLTRRELWSGCGLASRVPFCRFRTFGGFGQNFPRACSARSQQAKLTHSSQTPLFVVEPHWSASSELSRDGLRPRWPAGRLQCSTYGPWLPNDAHLGRPGLAWHQPIHSQNVRRRSPRLVPSRVQLRSCAMAAVQYPVTQASDPPHF